METLEYIKTKFNVNLGQESPISIPNHNRFNDLPALFKELGFDVGAEIGVSKGRYSKWLCTKHRKLKLYCIDPWIAYDDYMERHGEKGQTMLNEEYEMAKQKLAPFRCELIRKTSMDAVKDFEDGSLDFVFIDGNHSFEYVIEDIVQWSKKVKKGGIISGHDLWNSIEMDDSQLWIKHPTPYEKIKLCQVKDAVMAWTKTNQIKPWFLLEGDGDKTWFWVK